VDVALRLASEHLPSNVLEFCGSRLPPVKEVMLKLRKPGHN